MFGSGTFGSGTFGNPGGHQVAVRGLPAAKPAPRILTARADLIALARLIARGQRIASSPALLGVRPAAAARGHLVARGAVRTAARAQSRAAGRRLPDRLRDDEQALLALAFALRHSDRA